MATAPSAPAGSSPPLAGSRTFTRYPGTGLVGEPGFTRSGSSPMQLATMGHPDSVCHQ